MNEDSKPRKSQIHITEDQNKIIELIKTWDAVNVKTALMLDDSQGAGVQELYRDFFKKHNNPLFSTLAFDFEHFPVHYLFMFTRRCDFNIPETISSYNEFESFVLDYNILVGIDKDASFFITWTSLSAHSNYKELEYKIHALFKSLSGFRVRIYFSWVPF